MRILVTGAAGYLGSALSDALEDDGHEVWRLDHWGFGNPLVTPSYASGFRRICMDVRNPMVRKAIEVNDVEAVVHLAAILTVNACEKDKKLARSVHLMGTKNVFGVPGTRNVHVSTGAVFGALGGSRTESDPIMPETVYAKTKAWGEDAALKKGATVLRLNYMGGWSPGTRWVETVNFLARDAAKLGSVEVWEPGVTHPFTHVMDAVDAIRAVLPVPTTAGDVFHVLSENLKREVLCDYAREERAQARTRNVGHLKTDLLLDTVKIEKAVGWVPTRTIRDAFHDAAEAARSKA